MTKQESNPPANIARSPTIKSMIRFIILWSQTLASPWIATRNPREQAVVGIQRSFQVCIFRTWSFLSFRYCLHR